MINILPGLTTTPNSDWRKKTREIKKYNIKDMALFPTFLKKEERKELYDLLEESEIKNISHVHLRDDMDEAELDYLAGRYNVKVFNIHANEDTINFLGNSKYKDMIYVENQEEIDKVYLRALDIFSGICLDVSHFEDQGALLSNYGYDTFSDLLKKHKIGCSHVSAVGKKRNEYRNYRTNKKVVSYSDHFLSDYSELDYVKKYIEFLPELVSIELENSFREQLEIKTYLEKIINSAT